MPLLKFLYWSPYFLPILFIPHAIIHYFKQLVKEGYLLKRRQFLSSLSPKVDQHPPNIVGFFHPYCAAGGGGERVLWQSVKYCLERWEYTVCAIYTGDDLTKEEMVNRVKVSQFNISNI
jgi:alpha-1,2-mannosyltransferase